MVSTREQIKEGSISDNGEKIKSIIHKDSGLAIYFTEEGKPGFDCELSLIKRKPKIIRCHDIIVANIKIALRGEPKKVMYQRLGYALSVALMSNGDDPKVQLIPVAEMVKEQAAHQAKVSHVAGGAVCLFVASVMSIVCRVVLPEHSDIVTAALCGCAGAWASVVQRAHRFVPETYATPLHHGLTGLFRAGLGVVFGAALYVLTKSNFIVGFASENSYAIAALAFFAGWNERFVPEMLERVAMNADEKQSSLCEVCGDKNSLKQLPDKKE